MTSKGKILPQPFSPMLPFIKIFLIAALIFSFFYACHQLNISRYFPIKTVRVYGVKRMDQSDIKAAVSPLIDRGFFTINIDDIRDRLRSLPWISALYVRRVWPDGIEITIEEKKAVARFNDDGLLSAAGDIFSPDKKSYPAHLPTLRSPYGKQMMVLEHFHEINRLLIPIHAKISTLELTPYLTWKVTLNNGMVLHLGHKDVLTRLSHFVRVYANIIGDRSTEVDYVDLRYPNGMAVRWKPKKAY